MKYERHAYSEVFGDMDDESFKALVDDIDINGLKEKIAVFEGKIMDGWHRYKACLELGLEKIPMFEWEGSDPVGYVISRNHHRRHSTPSQRGITITELIDLSKKHGRPPKFLEKSGNFTTFSLDQAAAMAEVSKSTIQQAKKTSAKGIPEVKQAVMKGEISVSEAAKIVDQKPEDQKKSLEKRKNKPKAEKKASDTVPMNVYKELQSAYDEMVSNYDAMAVELQALDAYKDNRQVEEMRKMLIQIDSLKKLNDDLMNKNVELVKQVNYWKKKAKG
jgi:hypothetical protein